MSLPDPVLPPLFAGHALAAPREPFREACRQAEQGELGAGDVVWSRSPDRAALAIVLEPEVGAGHALQMAPLMLVAGGDCLAALMPAQVPIHHRWPDRLLLDGAEVGRLEIAHAPVERLDQAPAWLVVALAIRVRFPSAGREPGDTAELTALVEEGGGDLDRTQVLEALSAYLLKWLHAWQEGGFRPVHDAFMARMEGRGGELCIGSNGGGTVSGTPLGLDEHAGLILRRDDGRVTILGWPGGRAVASE